MPIFYADVHATVLQKNDFVPPYSSGLLVQYLLAATDIDEAVQRVQDHAFSEYLEQGEIIELYEVERQDAKAHVITVERSLNIDDPDLFEVLVVGSYRYSVRNMILRAKRKVMRSRVPWR